MCVWGGWWWFLTIIDGLDKSFARPSLLGSCLGSERISMRSACFVNVNAVVLKCDDELAPAVGRCWYYTHVPTPVPNVPQFTRNEQEIKRLKKQKGKKEKSPHPPTGPASTPELLRVEVCVCMHSCERISVCAAGAARVLEYEGCFVCVTRGGSMGVRGTPSISSPGQTPSLQDSRCSSSAERPRKKNAIKKKTNMLSETHWLFKSDASLPHRHFLQVAVVIVDRQAVELLLQLPHPLVVEVTRRDEPILVLLLQHFLEAALQELLLQQLLFHLMAETGEERRA